MNRRTVLLAAIVLCATGSVHALYSVCDHGAWPKSWPAELEPIRKQACTLVGPQFAFRHYQIPFTKREEFEAAWPHFLKIKSQGAPIILVRGPKTDIIAIKPAGLLIHSPPDDQVQGADSGKPIPGASNPRTTWRNTTFFELVVDGDIVDLNRIALPPDTPIIDERFTAEEVKSPARKTK